LTENHVFQNYSSQQFHRYYYDIHLNNDNDRVIKISTKVFTPHDIVLRDDAAHGKGSFSHVETWYYDAMFDNGYSVATLVNVIHVGKIGTVLTGLFIYKDAKLVGNVRNRVSYKRFYGSEEKPLIKLNGQQILKGHVDEDTKTWNYQISMGDHKQGVDLELVKITKAWKGKTFLGNWLVIPRFKINGTIFLDGNAIDVSGEGYHDHNIYPLYAPLINRGYHFGKIPVDLMNITWARVTKNRNNEEIIAVLNKGQEYISINPRDIRFTVENQIKDHGKLIPTVYRLNVKNDILDLNVKMESLNFHYIKVPAINYWRHHVRYTGEIQVDSTQKKIDTVDIMEQLIFL
jgi:hypothetical protein